jgi:hypothetical protein
MRNLFRRAIAFGVLTAATTVLAPQAGATLYLYDGFDYTPGAALGGDSGSGASGGQLNPMTGNRWQARSLGGSAYTTARDSVIESTNLSYANLQTSVGGSVRYGTSTSQGSSAVRYYDAISLPTVNSGSIYYSFIVHFNSAVSASGRTNFTGLTSDTALPGDAGTPSTPYSSSASIPVAAGAWIRNNGTTGYHLGSGKQNGDGLGTSASAASWQAATATSNQYGNTNGASQTQTFGTTTISPRDFFIVLKYTFNGASSNDDTVSMYVNPDASTLGYLGTGEPTAANAATDTYYTSINATVTGNFDISQIRSFQLLTHGLAPPSDASPAPSIDLNLDELRIGDSWLDVTPTPEPSSLALFAVSAGALLARRRRRQ